MVVSRPTDRTDRLDVDDDAETKRSRRAADRVARLRVGVDDDEDDGAVDPCVRMSDSS
jgi:hypothetical protein